jgi:hypothetical protein
MGRPEKPVTGTGPLAEFALGLRELRHLAGGPGYRELALRSRYSSSVLSEAAGGNRLPTWEATRAFVKACGGDVPEWQTRWQAAKEAMNQTTARARRHKKPVAMPDRPHAIQSGANTAALRSDGTLPRRPDPRQACTTSQLVDEMNRLRVWHGRPSLRRLASVSNHAFGASTLAEALNRRDKLPSLQLLTAFAIACGEPTGLIERWQAAWKDIALS